MLVNLTNHPSSKWSKDQMDAAIKDFTSVVDFPFPEIDPEWTMKEIDRLTDKVIAELRDTFSKSTDGGHFHLLVQGEFNFTFDLVSKLKTKWYHQPRLKPIYCCAATSKRVSTENPDGTKTVAFNFVQFRPYF